MSVTVKEVKGRKDLRRFIEFPLSLYKDCPYYVPGLFMDERDTLSPGRNPAFEFSQASLFLAWKDGQVAGRCAAIINTRANQSWQHDEVRYGWFDFIDDREVSKALIEAVIAYGREHGMSSIAGPLGFTDFDAEGMLVEGFGEISTFPLRYNYPYYMQHMEALGFSKVVDWLEYKIHLPAETPQRIARIAAIVEEKYDVHVRRINRRIIRRENLGMKIFELINRTYCDLFDFTQLTDKLVNKYVDTYLGLLDPKFITIVENGRGELVGFGICMPSIVHAVQRSRGRLFPFGWFRILRSMYWKYEDTIEMLLVAVDPAYAGKGVNALLYDTMVPLAYKCGFKYSETNAELEDNLKVQGPWDNFEHEQHKRRRIYGKQI